MTRCVHSRRRRRALQARGARPADASSPTSTRAREPVRARMADRGAGPRRGRVAGAGGVPALAGTLRQPPHSTRCACTRIASRSHSSATSRTSRGSRRSFSAGDESVIRLELKKGAVAFLELASPPTPGAAAAPLERQSEDPARAGLKLVPKRSTSRPCRRPRSLTVERVAAELGEHGADDARAGEDDLGALRLQADDRAALVRCRACGRARSAGRSRPRSSTVPWTTSGSYVASPCFTAARLVTAPPMPDERVGRGAAVEAREVGGDRLERRGERPSSTTAASRPKRSVKRTAPTSTLNRSSTLVAAGRT